MVLRGAIVAGVEKRVRERGERKVNERQNLLHVAEKCKATEYEGGRDLNFKITLTFSLAYDLLRKSDTYETWN